jgi:hypothetical protein
MRIRIPLCMLVLAFSALAADTDTPPPPPDDTADQAQAPAPQTPAPADQTKPADTTPPAAPPKYNGFVFSGLADGYVTANYNHPASKINQLQNFDLNYDQPLISLIKFTVDKSDKVVGFHVDTGFGETMRWIHAADPAAIEHQGLRYLEQMYVIFKPAHTNGSEFDFGEFVTSAGAEVIESSTNWNYTRSLLFAWAIPYYHFGFRSAIPLTKSYTVGVQVVNAWNTVWGNNEMRNVGLTSVLTKPKFTWSVNYYVGPNHQGTTSGKRNLVDTTLLLTPVSKASFYVNYDYGQDNHPTDTGHDTWYGFAVAGRVQLTKKIAVAARGEWFKDVNGFATGVAQTLKEGTVTGEYKYNDHFVGRVEYRHDASDQPFFDVGGQPASSKGMNTFTLGLVALLGPLK